MSKYVFGILGLIWMAIFSCGDLLPTYQDLPQTEAELGEALFFNPILSLDSSISCASCHLPSHAFSDTTAFSKGVKGKLGNRNTPSVTNMASRSVFFWDGRASSLSEQALFPIRNPIEMNLEVNSAVQRIRETGYLNATFKSIYGKGVDSVLLGKALAAFEQTLETTFTRFDYFMDGDSNAISVSAQRGQVIFNEKGKCFDCHFGPDFTGDEFKNIGLFNGEELNDSGRYLVSGLKEDIGKFKVPGLRNTQKTGPYMHNGMFATIEEVIDYYNVPDRFVPNHQGRDSLVEPLGLNHQERADLLAFLLTLTPAKG